MEKTSKKWKYIKDIEEMKLFDDSFMTLAFNENIECVQLMLRIIMGRDDIFVKSVKTQSPQPVFTGHSAIFDIDVRDINDIQIDVELQKSDGGAIPERARYHSSLIDTHQLQKNNDYSTLKDSYVIFITKNDVLGSGIPIYEIDRTIKQTGKTFNDGSHIIYVNGAYKDTNTDIGKLIHDLMCSKSEEIYFKELAKQVKYYKETEKGMSEMCEVMERILNREKEDIIRKLLKKGNDTFEEIADCVGVPVETVKKIADEICELV